MTNVIQFRSKPCDAEAPKESCGSNKHVGAAALCARAGDALSLLTSQLELAIQHARIIEPRIHDPEMRQLFGDRIELTQRLLEVAHLKILLLQFGSPLADGRCPYFSGR
jgi:hypothetical protein